MEDEPDDAVGHGGPHDAVGGGSRELAQGRPAGPHHELAEAASLVSLPVLTSQWGHTDEELREAGVTRSMARLSIGLEDPQDLIADLDQALG